MKICDAITAAKNNNERSIGGILSVIAGCSDEAREIIEQDLDNKQMSLAACFKALEDYARQHKTGSCFACAVLGVEPENEVVKVICDFYKIPDTWYRAQQNPSTTNVVPLPLGKGGKAKTSRVNLMELI